MNRSSKTGGVFQPQTLDVDDSILGKALQIVDNGGDDFLPKNVPMAAKNISLPKRAADNVPVVKVTPSPGLCVKSKNISGEKVFINLCKIGQIPPPPPLSEDKLKEIIASEDYGTDFRVPMSLGGPREEKDKSGSSCTACDVAINTVWFEDVMYDSIAFTTFVVNIAMEGLCEKFGDKVNLDRQNWTILKNKKYLGTLQKHHIQQRANTPGEFSKIREISESAVNEASTVKYPDIDYHIVRTPVEGLAERLTASLKLPGQVSKSGLELDIGEDRLVFAAPKRKTLDIYLPYKVDQARANADFDVDAQVLTVNMPLQAEV